MISRTESLVVLSGHFNPLHEGHIDMIEAGARLGNVCVIVKNDRQQMEKKGRIIRPQEERIRAVSELAVVRHVVLSLDTDDSVQATLAGIAVQFPDRTIIFGNGGDTSDVNSVPETEICRELGIKMLVGLGGFEKVTSSTLINTQLGLE